MHALEVLEELTKAPASFREIIVHERDGPRHATGRRERTPRTVGAAGAPGELRAARDTSVRMVRRELLAVPTQDAGPAIRWVESFLRTFSRLLRESDRFHGTKFPHGGRAGIAVHSLDGAPETAAQ